jgi:hypothetical protein
MFDQQLDRIWNACYFVFDTEESVVWQHETKRHTCFLLVVCVLIFFYECWANYGGGVNCEVRVVVNYVTDWATVPSDNEVVAQFITWKMAASWSFETVSQPRRPRVESSSQWETSCLSSVALCLYLSGHWYYVVCLYVVICDRSVLVMLKSD